MKKIFIYLLVLLVTIHWNTDVAAQAKGSFAVYSVASLSGNSDDMAPVVLNDGILFCSNRKTNPFFTHKNFEGVRLFDLYFAPFDNEGNPANPEKFTSGLGKNVNIGPAYLTADGNTLYFTRNYIPGDKLKKSQSNKLGIFTATRNGSSWTDIKPFEYNNPDYNLSYPNISPDGRYLFFSSDMPGTMGKYDIFMCENIDGRWSKPVNMGQNINTSDAEINPFLHTSGRLYFASDRKGGLGGLDIYFSTLTYGNWTRPVRLDDPINSEADDFAFFALPGGQEGYFTSNRKHSVDGIYRFATTIIRWSNCSEQQNNSYCYEFIEENALKSDTSGLKFRWEWNFGDGAKATGITSEHCFQGPGVYDITLDIVNLITGQIEKRQASYVLEIEDIAQPVITAPDTIMTGESFSLNAASTFLPGIRIARYYWNFGDDTAATGVEVSKTYQLPGKYNIQLIITSEPDAGGVIREACVCRDIEIINAGK